MTLSEPLSLLAVQLAITPTVWVVFARFAQMAMSAVETVIKAAVEALSVLKELPRKQHAQTTWTAQTGAISAQLVKSSILVATV